MISYTKTNVSILSFLLSILLVVVVHFLFLKIQRIVTQNEVEIGKQEESKKVQYIEVEPVKLAKVATAEEIINVKGWEIEIPKISLHAPIAEGTTKEVMNEFVGHFTGSSVWEGSVALAAHNRGYPVNYFENLKDLQMGDVILYHTKYGTKRYEVASIQKIEDTDWSWIEITKENTITLITCVENEPKFRRCIQGIEIKSN